MEINGTMAIGIILVLIFLPFLFSAGKESGRLKMPRMPKLGRKPSAFRQFPTMPPQGDDLEFD